MYHYSPSELLHISSPAGRWFIKQLHHLPTLYTSNLGSRLRFTALNVTTLRVNVLDNRNELSPAQIYAWRVNGGPWHRELAANHYWQIECGSGKQLVEIMTAGNTDLDRVWTGDQGFAISTIDAQDGELIPAPQLPVIDFIGDSITAGCWVNGRHAAIDYRPESNYVGIAMDLLHTSDVRIAYSAGGVLRQATGGVPTAEHFLTNTDAATPWHANRPALVVINLGVNDRRFPLADFTAAYDHFLHLVAQVFPQTQILVMIPFSQTFADPIRQLAHQYHFPVIETTNWCPSYTDGLHPDQAGATESGKRLAEALSNWLK